uniref:Ovule protein n=1 Tax=Heterorhabditis bacteriophora TaxID=37862 RepID=A0A1I7W609_HETBA
MFGQTSYIITYKRKNYFKSYKGNNKTVDTTIKAIVVHKKTAFSLKCSRLFYVLFYSEQLLYFICTVFIYFSCTFSLNSTRR